ncbi:hypothetical protein PIB30_030237 [Stylosanthes scabra]|uniref:Uncharacterized protein n=1 Tax=Stylosanthes scabra TaxID=79078 RepID=A0ABU6WBF3_9FABA|nr:hypothetical protein [Stylosanthes scabra]
MGHDDRTRFFFWDWFMALDRFNPLRRIGLATNQVSVLLDLCHCQTGPLFSLSYLSGYDETYRTSSPSSSCLSKFVSLFRFHRERSSGAQAFAPYTLTSDGSSSGLGTYVPHIRTPMSDARHYRSLFSRHRVATPTPPPPSPPSSDDEPSVETFDPAAELEGDPDEPYIAEHVPIGAPEAYYSDASYRSEQESASTDSAPSSHHSSGSSSGRVSLGYGSASSGSASDGASDDDLVNRYFAGTFPPL